MPSHGELMYAAAVIQARRRGRLFSHMLMQQRGRDGDDSQGGIGRVRFGLVVPTAIETPSGARLTQQHGAGAASGSGGVSIDAILMMAMSVVDAPERKRRRLDGPSFDKIGAPPRDGLGATTKACSICLEATDTDAPLVQLACGHVFHRECVREWLCRTQATCPNCRAPVESEGRRREEGDATSEEGGRV